MLGAQPHDGDGKDEAAAPRGWHTDSSGV